MQRSGAFFRTARLLRLLLLLVVLVINNFHCVLGNNGSQRKTIRKRSIQGLDPNLPDSLSRRTNGRSVIATLELQEESEGPFPLFVGELFNDTLYDPSLKYFISGPGVNENPEFGLFSIEDNANGRVYVHRPVDREQTPSFMIHFSVADRKTGVIVEKPLDFNIKIKDINDNAPEFPKKEYNITMKENHQRDEPVFQVTASDKDEKGNSRVAYSLVSQTPRLKEPVFTVDSSSGRIRISGCSDYETARTFKLLIKATDDGCTTLSSTATINIAVEDSNNNLPVFTQENYQADIPEGKTEHDVLRLRVEDQDSPHTPAWRAEYQIVRGNEEENFLIQTDPDTNEGILSIVKPLTYDGTSERKLVISVENEEALFTCHRGLMKNPSKSFSNVIVSINVTARNRAPQFTPPVLFLRLEEEMLPGTFLVQYTARDPDIPPNSIRYKVASDPNGWVTINENSGTVTMRKKVDKDALDWKNRVYPIVIHAIDDGLPQLTGTGTIQLHVSYQLRLVTSFLEICEGKENGPFRIQVENRDSHPFAEPFTFKLNEALQNVKNFWKLGGHFGDSVELLMVKSPPLGDYFVPLEIFNKQGLSRKQTLKVTVCRCLNGDTCESRTSPKVGSLGLGGLAAILLGSFLLLLLVVGLILWHYRSQLNQWCGGLLVPAKLSQDRKGPPYIPYEESNQSLIHYSEESQPALPRPGPVYASAPNRKKPLDTIVETVGKILNQKFQLIMSSEDQNAFYSPRVYAEEGELEKSGSFWSLPGEDNRRLPPDFLNTLGPVFAKLDNISSK